MNRPLASILLALGLATLAAGPALAKPGNTKNLGKKPWPNVHGMAPIDGKIYVSAGSTIYVSDKNGKFTDLFQGKDHEFGNAEQLTVLDGKVYLISGGMLYEVDKTGKVANLGKGWRYDNGMAALDGKLYVVSNDSLYVIDKPGATPRRLGDTWYNVHGMTELGGKLYIVSNQTLSEVDKDGTTTKLEGTWENVLGITSANGKLYIYTFDKNPVLHEVDRTGKGTALLPTGLDGKSGISAITSVDGTLYMTVAELADSNFFAVETK